MRLAAALLLALSGGLQAEVEGFLIPGGLTVEEFTKLHKELQPSKDDVWKSIPWKVSLAEAVAQAAKEKKPVFMWSMDGHPMGCT